MYIAPSLGHAMPPRTGAGAHCSVRTRPRASCHHIRAAALDGNRALAGRKPRGFSPGG
jgi:hypothetical protein